MPEGIPSLPFRDDGCGKSAGRAMCPADCVFGKRLGYSDSGAWRSRLFVLYLVARSRVRPCGTDDSVPNVCRCAGKERLEGDSPSPKTRLDDEKTAVFPLAVVVAGDGSCARSGRGSRFDGLLPGDPLRSDRDGQRPDRSGSDVPVFPELLNQVRFARMLSARRRQNLLISKCLLWRKNRQWAKKL